MSPFFYSQISNLSTPLSDSASTVVVNGLVLNKVQFRARRATEYADHTTEMDSSAEEAVSAQNSESDSRAEAGFMATVRGIPNRLKKTLGFRLGSIAENDPGDFITRLRMSASAGNDIWSYELLASMEKEKISLLNKVSNWEGKCLPVEEDGRMMEIERAKKFDKEELQGSTSKEPFSSLYDPAVVPTEKLMAMKGNDDVDPDGTESLASSSEETRTPSGNDSESPRNSPAVSDVSFLDASLMSNVSEGDSEKKESLGLVALPKEQKERLPKLPKEQISLRLSQSLSQWEERRLGYLVRFPGSKTQKVLKRLWRVRIDIGKPVDFTAIMLQTLKKSNGNVGQFLDGLERQMILMGVKDFEPLRLSDAEKAQFEQRKESIEMARMWIEAEVRREMAL